MYCFTCSKRPNSLNALLRISLNEYELMKNYEERMQFAILSDYNSLFKSNYLKIIIKEISVKLLIFHNTNERLISKIEPMHSNDTLVLKSCVFALVKQYFNYIFCIFCWDKLIKINFSMNRYFLLNFLYC